MGAQAAGVAGQHLILAFVDLHGQTDHPFSEGVDDLIEQLQEQTDA